MRQLATTSSDKTVKLWNLDGFTLDRTLAGELACQAISCRLIALFWDGILKRPAVGPTWVGLHVPTGPCCLRLAPAIRLLPPEPATNPAPSRPSALGV